MKEENPDKNRELRYAAFISHASEDRKWAIWLRRSLERYRLPRRLARELNHKSKRIGTIFRDRDELAASSDLGETINQHLGDSETLIVICSPQSARSQWVNAEIQEFRDLGRQDRIFAFIVDGEPPEECFPPALQEFEPLGADAREVGDSKLDAKRRLIAGLLGVGFNDLRRREVRRVRRRLITSIVVMAMIAAGFAVLAFEANRQRTEAVDARKDADRQRIVAEENEARAQEARDETEVQLARSFVRRGWGFYEQDDRPGAFLWHAEAYARLFDRLKERGEAPLQNPVLDAYRLRLASTLEQIPKHRLLGWSVEAMDFSPDGKWVAVAHHQNLGIQLFELPTMKESANIPQVAKGGRVKGVAFLADGRHVVTWQAEGFLYVWDLAGADAKEPWKPLRTFDTPKTDYNSPQIVAAVGPERPGMVAFRGSDTIRFWDVLGENSSEPILERSFNPQNGYVSSSPNGRFLVWDEPVEPKGFRALLFDADNPGNEMPEVAASGENIPVNATWAPDSSWVAVRQDDQKVARFITSGADIELERNWISQIVGYGGGLSTAHHGQSGKAFAPVLVDGTRGIRFWNPETGKQGRRLEPIGPGTVTGRISPSGKLVFAYSNAGISGVYDLGTYPGELTAGRLRVPPRWALASQQVRFAPDPQNPSWIEPSVGYHVFPRALVVSTRAEPSGKLTPLPSGSESALFATRWEDNQQIAVLDAAAISKPLFSVGHPRGFHKPWLSPDGKYLTVAARKKPLELWVFERQGAGFGREPCCVVRPAGDPINHDNGHIVSPDGTRLLFTHRDRRILLYDITGPVAEEPVAVLELPGPTGSMGLSVAWHPAGSHVAVGTNTRILVLWEPETGRMDYVQTYSTGIVKARFIGDGTLIGAGGGVWAWSSDPEGQLKLEATVRPTFPTSSPLLADHWDGGSERAALGFASGDAMAWDWNGNKPAGPLIDTGLGRVDLVNLARDGRWLATGTGFYEMSKHTWRLWEVETGIAITPPVEIDARRKVTHDSLEILADSRRVITTGHNGHTLWDISGDEARWPLSIDETRDLAQLLAYRRINVDGHVETLDQEDWETVWLKTSKRVRNRFMRDGLVLGAPKDLVSP